MKKNVLIKEFWKEIKSSRNRFISILLIVFLGVAFFAGIRAAGPDMRLSADAYYDDADLMDLKIIGTLGLTDDDVKEIEKIPGIQNVVPGYTADVFCNTEQDKLILHLMSLSDSINKVTVTKGRLPQKADECLADENFIAKSKKYKIGDQITVTADDGEIGDILTTDTFTIVGTGNSPYYLSMERGSSSIGTGEISSFIMLPPESFSMEAYTEITANVEGVKGLDGYSDEYEDQVEIVQDKAKEIEDERCKARYDSLKTEGDEKIADGEKEIQDAKDKLADAAAEITDGEQAVSDAWDTIHEKEADIQDAEAAIADNQEKLGNGWQEYNDGYAEYESGYSQWEDSEAELTASEEELSSGKEQLDAAWNAWDTQGQPQLDELNSQLAQMEAILQTPGLPEEQRAQTEAGRQALIEGIGQAEAQRDQIQQQQDVYDSGRAQLDEGWESLNSAKAELDSALATLESSRKELEDGEASLETGKQELEEGKVKLADAKTELQTKEQELKDGKADYEEESAKAENEIRDAEEKIADAKKELGDLEVPTWYVLDRNSIETYISYGQDAERIEAIGNVFPVIFFLVAALICLTTMTRMVEENRIQIGTLKALGYKNGTIASKYLAYAFLATFTGGIVGLVFGQKLLPVVIINAYGILYNNLPSVLAPLHRVYSVTSMAAAIGCTLAATLAACFRETTSVPANLMRPEAPKSGKRIFLERIGIIWKHLNFSHKATFRNLFRYKKRFYMTVLGIGGCMGLLLVGFGLKDSITAIGKLQYGKICTYDGILDLDKDRSDEQEQDLRKKIKEDQTISDYLFQHTSSTDITFDNIKKTSYIIVPEQKEKLSEFIRFQDRLTGESYELDDEGIFISEKLSKLLDIGEGDTVQLKDGDAGQVEVKVSHIVENYFYHYIYISPKLYEELFKEPASYDNVFLSLGDVSDEAETALRSRMMNETGVAGINFVTKVAQRVDDMLKSMNTIIYVLVISAGLLAFIVLYNLNNINISERKRELATLKVLGFYDGEVSNYVFHENIWLTLLGCLGGVVIGLLLHRFVITTVEIDIMMFGRNINLLSYVYSVGLTFLFSATVNLTMHFKLKKIDMVESMKSVE